jgi:hypothetical protein
MPANALDEQGWQQVDERVETLFSLPGMRVRGATVRYEDDRTSDALEEATDGNVDIAAQFLAGTRVGFDPPLPPGVAASMVAPTLRSEARQNFATRLEERGLVGVERDGSQRIKINRKRARVTKFRATMPLDWADLPLACWVAVWTPRPGATIVTGGHPSVTLAEQFDLDSDEACLHRSGEAYRNEFFEFLRAVE